MLQRVMLQLFSKCLLESNPEATKVSVEALAINVRIAYKYVRTASEYLFCNGLFLPHCLAQLNAIKLDFLLSANANQKKLKHVE